VCAGLEEGGELGRRLERLAVGEKRRSQSIAVAVQAFWRGLYLGSWEGWSRREELPVARPPQ
jgi:hypothetical protein